MRKIAMLFAFALIFIHPTHADPFDVTTTFSSPSLNPGDRNVELRFVVQNTQDIMVGSIRVYLFLDHPFSASLPPNTRTSEMIDPGYLIGAGQMEDEHTPSFSLAPRGARTTLFKIDVDRNAEHGYYDVPYTIFYDSLGSKQYTGKIKVRVGGNTLVDITNVTVDKAAVEPGDVFGITVAVQNLGDNEIRWLKLQLNPMDKALVPLSSDSESVFKDISLGAREEAQFRFSLEKDAQAKNYPVDILLSYMDERGVEYNETKLVGIAAAGRANLDIAKKTTEPASIKENGPFTLTLKIENTGTGDAKGVAARIESELDGDTLAYLGEIKKDDYSNAIFTLNAASGGKKNGILRLTYEDDFGKHEIQKEVILIVNPGDGQSPLPALIGVIAVAGGIFFWKRRKH